MAHDSHLILPFFHRWFRDCQLQVEVVVYALIVLGEGGLLRGQQRRLCFCVHIGLERHFLHTTNQLLLKRKSKSY